MKLRTLVAGAVVAGFLAAGVPTLVHAQEHPGMGRLRRASHVASQLLVE
ncbi:MAG: hypothetical protein ACLQBA_13060 [Candidatus Binataceae bacterium]